MGVGCGLDPGMCWGQAVPWGLGSGVGCGLGPRVCGARLALGSGLGGRLWAGPGVCGVGAGLCTGSGCVRVGLCHGVKLGPGVCWSRAGPWGLGSGVGCGLGSRVCGAGLG